MKSVEDGAGFFLSFLGRCVKGRLIEIRRHTGEKDNTSYSLLLDAADELFTQIAGRGWKLQDVKDGIFAFSTVAIRPQRRQRLTKQLVSRWCEQEKRIKNASQADPFLKGLRIANPQGIHCALIITMQMWKVAVASDPSVLSTLREEKTWVRFRNTLADPSAYNMTEMMRWLGQGIFTQQAIPLYQALIQSIREEIAEANDDERLTQWNYTIYINVA